MSKPYHIKGFDIYFNPMISKYGDGGSRTALSLKHYNSSVYKGLELVLKLFDYVFDYV